LDVGHKAGLLLGVTRGRRYSRNFWERGVYQGGGEEEESLEKKKSCGLPRNTRGGTAPGNKKSKGKNQKTFACRGRSGGSKAGRTKFPKKNNNGARES